MADISLRMSGLSVTCVSNAFIDYYMASATGEYVKIYIYLLRCLEQEGEAFSVQKIAEKLGHTDLDVKRAFDYWEQQGMIRQERDSYGQLTGICVLDPLTQGFGTVPAPGQERPITISAAPVPPAPQGVPAAASGIPATAQSIPAAPQSIPAAAQSISAVPQSVPATPLMQGVQPAPVMQSMPVPPAPVVMPQMLPEVNEGIQEVSAAEVSSYENDEAFSELLFLAETYIGHPLSSKDIDRVLFWYDGLGMSADLVEYLITYCADKGHDSLSYMNKIALSWADSGIVTVDQAKAETSRHSEIYYAVCTGFGITGRNLTPAELDYIKRWEGMFEGTDIIREACNRTILRTGRNAFGYADRILGDWHDHGIRTVSDIDNYDKAYAAKNKKTKKPAGHKGGAKDAFHNFEGREYEDWDAIEARLLAKK